MATFYNNLKKALEISKRSIEELAQHIGCQPSDFEKYDSEEVILDNSHFPDYDTIASIADYLGFSEVSLISGAFPVKEWVDRGQRRQDLYDDYKNARTDEEKLLILRECGIPEDFKHDHDRIIREKYGLNKAQQCDFVAKVALFEGNNNVTDEEWDEVKKIVNEIKKRHNKQ